MINKQIDALVAEKIFPEKVTEAWGKKWFIDKEEGNQKYLTFIPKFTEDIAAAWQVVEKMNKPFFIWKDIDGYYGARFDSMKYSSRDIVEPAAAICIAALRTVGVEIE